MLVTTTVALLGAFAPHATAGGPGSGPLDVAAGTTTAINTTQVYNSIAIHDGSALTVGSGGNVDVAGGISSSGELQVLGGGYLESGPVYNGHAYVGTQPASILISGAGSKMVVNYWSHGTNPASPGTVPYDDGSMYGGRDLPGTITISDGGKLEILGAGWGADFSNYGPRVPGLYLGGSPWAAMSVGTAGELNGDGGFIHSNVFVYDLGIVSPGDPGAANSTGTINITGGGNLTFNGGQFNVDVKNPGEGDRLNFTEGGNLTFANPIVLKLWLAQEVIDAGVFDVNVVMGADSIVGFDQSHVSVAGLDSGWTVDFLVTNGTGTLRGTFVPEPSTYALWGGVASLLGALCLRRRKR
jgi:hypothetical protein